MKRLKSWITRLSIAWTSYIAKARAADNARRASYEYRWWKSIASGRISTHIGRYDNESEMDAEIASASNYGWIVKNIATFGSHINVGRTVAPMVLTGGLSLLQGASRSKERYIVTFERDGRISEAA